MHTREEVRNARARVAAIYGEIRSLEEQIKTLKREASILHDKVLEKVPQAGWVRSTARERCTRCGRKTDWVFYDSDGQGGPRCHWQCAETEASKFSRELSAYLYITGFHEDEATK
jgi:hypothetical protein